MTVSDEAYRRARLHAAQAGTSVSRMVADFLWSVGDDDLAIAEAATAREALAQRITGFRASDRLPRDDIHDRAAIR
ncbi:hypothetical protein GCM10023351_30280 [Microbacterium gilvum]|uniref:Antitoxin n=1 Tax=Microbacterium gilvum TaxID=1336204 RepID=A0ABP9AKX6_9MICO